MTARTLPTAPSFGYQQGITSTQLNALSTYMQFWANAPGFRAEQHTSQSILNAQNEQVTCDTVIHDSDSGLQSASPFSYVIPFAGLWDFAGGVGFASNATGMRYAMLWQNGSPINGASPDDPETANATLYPVVASQILCQVGDVIALYAYQNSGNPLATVASGGQMCWFAGRLVSLASP